MIETDREKSWMYIEQNDDETCTATLNLPEFELYEENVVIQLNVRDFVGVAANLPEEERKDLFGKMTYIPNSPEEDLGP